MSCFGDVSFLQVLISVLCEVLLVKFKQHVGQQEDLFVSLA